ncbi:hypothetical protein G6F65_017397 [Rhizopus arrhizus]|nr:hypothetical protein G6F65_017397 [Rhizopus arrhizus]
MHLDFARSQFSQDAAEAQRFVAQRRAHPVIARRGRIAFVENQVDDLQHGRQARAAVLLVRHFKGHLGRGQATLGAHDPLGNRGLRRQEGAGDLCGRQTAQQAQRERHARFGGQHRMAGGEHQAQQVVTDIVLAGGVQRIDKIGFHVGLQGLQLVADLIVLAGVQRVQAQAVAGAVFCGGHQPRSRVIRHAGIGPALQGGHQRILRQLFSQADIAHQPRDAGDDAGGFDPPDRLDGPMGCRLAHAPAASPGTMYTSSQIWPSRSSKPWPYMKPWSCGARGAVPPAATARATRSSTSARLSQDRLICTAVAWVASTSGLPVNPWKKSLVSSMA